MLTNNIIFFHMIAWFDFSTFEILRMFILFKFFIILYSMSEKSHPISYETKLSSQTIRKNIVLMFLINFISALEFFSPIFTLYLQEKLNSGILISVIFVGGSLVVVIFEGPSGALGDLLGRKKNSSYCSVWTYSCIAILNIRG